MAAENREDSRRGALMPRYPIAARRLTVGVRAAAGAAVYIFAAHDGDSERPRFVVHV
jgi:hypothetical protein